MIKRRENSFFFTGFWNTLFPRKINICKNWRLKVISSFVFEFHCIKVCFLFGSSRLKKNKSHVAWRGGTRWQWHPSRVVASRRVRCWCGTSGATRASQVLGLFMHKVLLSTGKTFSNCFLLDRFLPPSQKNQQPAHWREVK